MILAFISYSHRDEGFVDRLYADLVRSGRRVWRDKENIQRGVNWDTEIQNVLRSGDITHVLFVQSINSVQSDIVLSELAEAFDNGIKYIVPLITDDSRTPLVVKRRNPIDFRVNYGAALSQLQSELDSYIQPREYKKNAPVIHKSDRTPTAEQVDAAHDPRRHVRLLAGPGTGKSFVIEERVRWLLANGTLAKSIFVISFTRASSADLRRRIENYCLEHSQKQVTSVNVSTLHSLALRILRKSGSLSMFPTDPAVLDDWEQKHIFDEEFKEEYGAAFAKKNNRSIPERAKQIRRFREALWSTGRENPVDYDMPDIPISEEERKSFERFHNLFSKTYSCVLPGEIVAQCVERIRLGLHPVDSLRLSHLVVDEFQDLNSADVEFVNAIGISDTPASVYVLGDDDQSIYSFRFAYPLGIQTFLHTYPQAGTHSLSKCFRCTPQILETADILIQKHALPQRLPKKTTSIHEGMNGTVKGYYFNSEQQEAKFIAASCKALIEKDIDPRSILVLISSRDLQLEPLVNAFEQANVAVNAQSEDPYINTEPGRYIYSILRIACDIKLEDYLAHRSAFGLLKGVGQKTCVSIRNKIAETNGLRYLDIFYYALPQDVFSAREFRAIEKARAVFEEIRTWREEDELAHRIDAIAQLVSKAFDNPDHGGYWKQYVSSLPKEMTLKELRNYLGALSQEQSAQILEDLYDRLELEKPEEGFIPPKVQIMTMHGAKGLNANVVFVPGLENEILPGHKRRRYAGLQLEAARMLYVSITRARAACILSYATSRKIGKDRDYNRVGSDLLLSLGLNFEPAQESLAASVVSIISKTVDALGNS